MKGEFDAQGKLYAFLDLLAGANGYGPVFYSKAEVIYEHDSPASSLFLLRSGRVKISKPGHVRRVAVLRIVRPGEVFGEENFAGARDRGIEARALDRAEVTEVPRAAFLDAAVREPYALAWLADMVDGRRLDALRRMDLLELKNVQERILTLLLDGVSPGAMERQAFTLNLPQSDLGGLIGASRETTSINLNALKRKGLIDLRRCAIEVPSADALRRELREIGDKPRSRPPRRWREGGAG